MPEAGRLRLVVLVHMPLGHGLPGEELPDARARERAALTAAAAVVATSEWTRRWLLEHYDLPPGPRPRRPARRRRRRHLCGKPGRRGAALCRGGDAGQGTGRAARGAGHGGGPGRGAATCVGDLTGTRASSASLARRAREGGIGDRIRFAGPRTGRDLDAAYAAADVLVLASRVETYGMVVTEALARGLPVVATAVGGVPEAVGHARRREPARPAGATRRPACPRPRRCGAGSATPTCDTACGRRRSSAGRRCPAGRPPLRGSPGPWRGRRHDRAGRPGQPGVAGAAGAGRRRGPRRRTRRADPDAVAGPAVARSSTTSAAGQARWGAGSPRACLARQHWVLYDHDAALLAHARADPPSLPPTGPRSPWRRGSATSPACARRAGRRQPGHRLGAARHAHRSRAGAVRCGLCRGATAPCW